MVTEAYIKEEFQKEEGVWELCLVKCICIPVYGTISTAPQNYFKLTMKLTIYLHRESHKFIVKNLRFFTDTIINDMWAL